MTFQKRRSSIRPAQTVLITGAAGGIGQALALRYAARGATLLLLDRDASSIATGRYTAAGASDVRTASVDVRDAAGVAHAVDDLAGSRPLDLVVNCAGVLGRPGRLVEMAPEEVEQVVSVNLLGSINVARAVVPHLAEGSRLALVASLGGLVAGYHYTAYSSSKFGVVGLAEALRMELGPSGVVVQVVCPGEVNTPMVEAEIAAGDRVLRQIKLLSGQPISAELAAQNIERGLERGRFMVIPTAQARGLWWSSRLLPVGARHAFTDLQIARATRKWGSAA